MTKSLLIEHHLEILNFEGGYTGSSESTLVKTPHFWKSHIVAQFYCLFSENEELSAKSHEQQGKS